MNDILENKLSIDQETYISLDMMELLLDEGDVNSSKEVIQRLKSRLKNKKNVNQCSKCGYESGHFFGDALNVMNGKQLTSKREEYE